jgi:hypothetical protein
MTKDKPKRKENVIVKPKKEGGLLFDIEKGGLYELNDTGFAVWNLCDGKTSLEGMEKKLSAKYELSKKEAKKVKDYLKELSGIGLLE